MNVNFGWLLSLVVLFEILIRVAAFFVIPRNRKPSSATGWLLLVFLFPLFGLAVFLLIGSPKLSKRRQAQQRVMNKIIDDAVDEAMHTPSMRPFVDLKIPERYEPFVTLNQNFSGMPVFNGNKIDIITDYQDTFDRLVQDVRRAKRFVHIEFFIIALDDTTEPLFEAMREAVARGVIVRVLFDSLGSRRYPRYREMKRTLTEYGIRWHVMLPLRFPGKLYTRPDLRNHRKIAVIDAEIGYTGSLNLIQRNYHRKDELYYDETMIRITGPVVTQLHGIFLTDWYSESDELLTRKLAPEITIGMKNSGDSLAQVLPSGPAFTTENNLKLFTSLIYAAKKRVVITNPYFVPDESLLQAITTAAQRGVEVVLINSAIMDQRMVGNAQRSFYEALLRAGVKIYWYKWPILLHAKHMTVDDDIAVIGSSNMDIRSFELNLEVSMIVYDKKIVSKLHTIETKYLAKSSRVTLKQWMQRSWHKKLFENIARLTSALQ